MLLFWEKYLLKLKKLGWPDSLSEEFSLKCLSVMICEQFIVSIVELIMLSWQSILLYNFHNIRVTWFFYHFFKLLVHILHSLEKISILIFGNCDLSYVTSFSVERASDYRRYPKISEVRRFPLVIP